MRTYMSIIIRPATKNDGQAVIDLLFNIAEFHHNGRPDIFRENFSKYNIEEYLELLGREDVFILVADVEEKVEGYAIAFYNDFEGDKAKHPSKYIYLDDLCVSPNCRKGGIGTALMEGVEEKAKALGCEKIELNVWNFKGNALEFYQKCGYSPMCIRMEKKI